MDKNIEKLSTLPYRSIFSPIPTVPKRNKGVLDVWPRYRDGSEEQMKKIWDLGKHYPFSSTWAVSYYNKFMCVVNCFPGYYIGSVFCKAVNLPRTGFGAMAVFAPALMGSVSFSIFFDI